MIESRACEEFERRLEALVAARDDETGRGELLASLRRHASTCRRCVEASRLVDWAALPVARRDPVSDPGEAYWLGLDRRVTEAIDAERRRSRRHGAIGLAAAAAALAGLALGAWLTLGRSPDAARSRQIVEPTDAWSPETADDAVDSLAPFDVWSGDSETGDWLFPPLDEMDDEGRIRLREWLESETRRLSGGHA